MAGLSYAGAIAAIVFVFDQASKYWVLAAYDLRTIGRVEVFGPLNFVFALNTGVNFGIGASNSVYQPYFLASFALIAAVALLIWAARTTRPYIPLGCGLLVGGALANGLDRIRFGGVVDFINLDCCGIGNPFAFNIADVAIFAGALLVAWFAWGDGPSNATESAEPDRN